MSSWAERFKKGFANGKKDVKRKNEAEQKAYEAAREMNMLSDQPSKKKVRRRAIRDIIRYKG